VTPSVGYLPERVRSDRADIFKITLEPGQTITFVAELTAGRLARVYLWKPIDYELKARERQLFNGIMLGIVGLLGIFLTAVFAANHKAIFPCAALVSWCVLAYLCVDFGFWHKLFQLRAEETAVHRAATEAAMAASLVVFLHAFLRIGSWHGFIRMLWTVWTVAQLALIAVAVVDPRLAATFARASFVAIGGIGALVTLFLALRGQDRALSLVPTWVLFIVWIFAAGLTVTGRLGGEVIISGLAAGLVLCVVLLGFTVTQYAFRSVEPLYGATPSEQQLRSLAVDGAGAAVFEWLAKRQEIKTSPLIEQALGLRPGDLSTKVDDFVRYVHPADRERFQLLLWSTEERGGGAMRLDYRMRHSDGSYRWLNLEAHSVPGAERRSLRAVGLLRDITEQKRSTERLMHDAVHDNLTGLPNRELFIDRLQTAFVRAKAEANVRPTIMFIDIDKFKSVNSSFGLIVGDSLLLTVSRRLSKLLNPLDTLARVSGDQFALLTLSEKDPREFALVAEQVRRSLRAPIRIAGQDIVLTASIGLSVFDGQQQEGADLLKEAEVAMHRAKRGGADRIEIFTPDMRAERDDRVAIESDLRRAIEKRQIKVLYQPIISLATEQLAGFEALVRWEHPKLGLLNPAEFIPVAEESDLIVKLGSVVLDKAVAEVVRWQKELPRETDPLFVSVNVSSRQLFRPELVQEVRQLLSRAVIPPGSLRLEITESLVMENAEQAAEVLEWVRGAGAGLSLDDFGTGYSSLAYLQTFPFDTIKIDRAIVQSGLADGTGSPIVRSIVALSHELGKKVVAEGVETGADVGFLRSLGCEFAQGFYYGEPMPEREVMQLLRVVRKSERKLQRRGFFRTKTRSQTPASKPAAAAAAVATAASVEKRVAAVTGGQARIRSRAAQPMARAPQPHPPVNPVTQTRPAPPPPPQLQTTPVFVPPPPVEPPPPHVHVMQPPAIHQTVTAALPPMSAVLPEMQQPPAAPPQDMAVRPPVPQAPAPRTAALAPSVGRAFEPPRDPTRRPTGSPRPLNTGNSSGASQQLPPAIAASLARLAGRTSTAPPGAPLPASKPLKSDT
jgi:diguanylate cyclase (GGDEF)-like protein/PAS domain S-box-containing protein